MNAEQLKMDQRPKEPYHFAGNITVAANTINQIVFNIDTGYDFLAKEFTFKSTCNNANSIPTFDIMFLANEKQLSNNFMRNEMFAGVMTELSTAPDTRYVMGLTNWYKFPYPALFRSNGNIIVRLRDTSGQANTIDIVIGGIKMIYAR
jgi:hypothetical protein